MMINRGWFRCFENIFSSHIAACLCAAIKSDWSSFNWCLSTCWFTNYGIFTQLWFENQWEFFCLKVWIHYLKQSRKWRETVILSHLCKAFSSCSGLSPILRRTRRRLLFPAKHEDQNAEKIQKQNFLGFNFDCVFGWWLLLIKFSFVQNIGYYRRHL